MHKKMEIILLLLLHNVPLLLLLLSKPDPFFETAFARTHTQLLKEQIVYEIAHSMRVHTHMRQCSRGGT